MFTVTDIETGKLFTRACTLTREPLEAVTFACYDDAEAWIHANGLTFLDCWIS